MNLEAGVKSADQLHERRYTTKEFSALSGVSRAKLRRWESRLQLRVNRDSHGTRYYTEADLGAFLQIEALRQQGYNLTLIHRLLSGADLLSPAPVVYTREEPGSESGPETDMAFEQRRKQLIAEMQEAFRGAVRDITSGAVKEAVDEVLREQAVTLENNLTVKLYARGERLSDNLVEKFNSDRRNNQDVAVVARRQMEEKRRIYELEQAAKPKKSRLRRALDVFLGKE